MAIVRYDHRLKAESRKASKGKIEGKTSTLIARKTNKLHSVMGLFLDYAPNCQNKTCCRVEATEDRLLLHRLSDGYIENKADQAPLLSATWPD